MDAALARLAVGALLLGLSTSLISCVSTPRVSAETPSPTASAEPTVMTPGIGLPADVAWLKVRGIIPRSIPVVRPTYLPSRFDASQVILQYAYETPYYQPLVDGWTYEVWYRSAAGSVAFALGSVNSSPPKSSEIIEVRGNQGYLVTTVGWPAIEVNWTEAGGHSYSIQSSDLSRDELLRVVAGLVTVP